MVTLTHIILINLKFAQICHKHGDLENILNDHYNSLASTHALTCVLRGSSIFWVRVNLENLLIWDYYIFQSQKKKNLGLWWKIISSHIIFITPLGLLWLENVVIPNYNKCTKLILTQKIEEPLSTRVSTCSKASL